MCDADRQTETYQHTLKHYIFVIGDMSLIDCINVGDCVVQQIRYLPMLFTIHHHSHLFVQVETLHISFEYLSYHSSS